MAPIPSWRHRFCKALALPGRCVTHGTLVLALCLVVPACDSSPTASSPPLRIGLLTPLSGPFPANVGLPSQVAAQIVVDRVNADGGLWVDGRQRKLELVVENSRADPGHAVEVVRRWIGQEDLVAFLGPMLSTTALPVASVAESYGMPMLTPTASHPGVIAGKRWVFRITFSDAVQGWALGHFAVEEVGPRCAVLFDQAADYSRGLAQIFRRAVEESGGEIVAAEAYVTGEQDFTAALQRIRQQGPDVLFLPNYINDIDLQLAHIRELGLKVQILGSDTWAVGAFAGRPEAVGAIRAVSWHRDLATAADEPFVAAFEQRFGGPPHGTAALTHDAMALLLAALEAAGPDPEALRRQLASTEGFRGLTGSLSFHRGKGASATLWLLKEDATGQADLRAVDLHGVGLDETAIHQ